MKRMSQAGMIFVLVLVALGLSGSVVLADNGTQVYRFSNEPFDFWQCYSQSAWFPGPAATFGQDVCVHYVARNSETVRFHGNAVAWSLIQHGTATVLDNHGVVLYSGPFQVEEIAKDYDGDADCVWSDGKHAWIGICQNLYGGMDFLNYNWKITGAAVYYFNLSISAPGQWCFSSKQGGVWGPGCK